MNLLKNLTIASIFAILILSACSKKDEFSPSLKGDIVGYAFSFDEYGNPLDDFSGINVSTLPNGQYNAVTDKDGRYELKDVVNGTYDLSFEKEGFGTIYINGVKHLGGKPTVMSYFYGNEAPFLYQYITTQITNLEFINDTIEMSVALSGEYEPYLFQLRLFFSAEENFSIESAQAIKNMTSITYFGKYRTHISVIEELPFESGITVYYKACLFTITDALMIENYHYVTGLDINMDYDTNETIYPNLSNESGEFSFIMP